MSKNSIKELIQNGLGSESVLFPDDHSVAVLPDSQVFTFDRVFTNISTQVLFN